MKTTFKLIHLLFLPLFFGSIANAQDGEALFKKCNVCHIIGKNSTGPNLQGVKQKWSDAGESELLYNWIKNSEELIAGGKSTMANQIKDFSATAMAPQVVSNEEIDAIFDYIDNWTPPLDPTTVTTNVPEVKIVPNYKNNLTYFYWLLTATVVLLLAIIMLSNSITTLVKSDFFKKKLIEKERCSTAKNLMTVAILVFISMSSQSAFGFSFNGPGIATENQPWLLIEKQDIYLLLVINLILLGVVFYLRKMFNQFMAIVKPPVEAVVETEAIGSKIGKILTNAVPIEEEYSILMDHEYDGIQELDNNLPTWWVWGFYATIVFAVIYIFNFHILKTSDLQLVAYDKEMKLKQEEVNAYLKKMAMNVDETNATLLTDSKDLSTGKTLFETNCVACHLQDGSGQIGPNLTDKYWLYGNDIKDVFATVKLGRPNGMPEHNSKLNPIQIQQVASYVLNLPEKAGKAAEGELVK